MPTYTTNLGLKVPVVGSDTNNWGDFLNSDLSYLDNIFEVSGTSISLLIGNQAINTPTATGQTTFTLQQIKLSDDRPIEFGTGLDYWLNYDSINTQFELNSTDVDGGGTNGIVFYVGDGTDDVFFTGTVDADHLTTTVLRVMDGDASAYVQFCAPSVVVKSYALCYPDESEAVGKALRVGAVDTSGLLDEVTLEWYSTDTTGSLLDNAKIWIGDTSNNAQEIALGGDVTMIADGTVTLGASQAGITTTANLTTVGILDAGSITSGFGEIDTGANTIITTGSIRGGNIIVDDAGKLMLEDTTGGEYVAFKAAGTTTSYTLIMPGGVPSADQVLSASDGGGTMAWTTPEVGDITAIVAGAGMTGTSLDGPIPTLNVIGTADKITVSADAVTIASSYVGQTSITTLGTIATGVWNGTAIANANLANSTVSYGGVSVALGASDATPAFNLSDATAYVGDSSLVTTGVLNSGSIGSSFGAIDVDSSAISGGAGTFSSVTVGSGASGTISSAIVNVRDFLGLYDADASHYVSIQALDVTTASYTITLPAGVGSSGQVLENQGSGTLEWVNPTVGDITSVDNATNGGLTVTNPTAGDVTLALDFSDLATIASPYVKVADDSIAFLDATDGSTNRVTIPQLMAAVAGTGITAITNPLDTAYGTLTADNTNANALTGTTLASNVLTSSLTTVGILASGGISSGFGAIHVGASNINGGTITAETALVGTLSTAAQTNITSVGILDGGSITSNFGAINTLSAITTTGTMSSGIVYSDNVVVTNGGVVSLNDDSLYSVKLTAPSAVTATYTLTFPAGVGSSGQVLENQGSGTLAWVTTGGDITGITTATDSGLAGGATSGTPSLSVDLNNLAQIASPYVKVADDSIAFLDADGGGGSGSTNLVTIPHLMAAVAGTGITAITDPLDAAYGTLTADTVAAAAVTLTGDTLAGNVLTSSLTTVGTISSGSWAVSGASIAAQYGGTGHISYSAGQMLYAADANTLHKLVPTSAGHVMTLATSGSDLIPSWAAPATATADASTLTGTTLNSPVVTSSLTTVGALIAGSIVPGFGSISTTGTIATTGTLRGTSIFLATAVSDKFYFSDDADDHTYMYESAADTISLVAGGTTSVSVTATGTSFNDTNITNVGNIALDQVSSDGTTAPWCLGTGSTGATEAADSVDNAGLFIRSNVNTGFGMALGTASSGDAYIQGVYQDGTSSKTIHLNPYAGGVAVAGALSKGSGSFKIDHPLPSMKDTHSLVHSFTESPRADLIYRGSVALSSGSASVDLDAEVGMADGTWELLCRDPQVFLQNESGWSALKGSVSGSTLIITCKDTTSSDIISWMVVAERQDEHMKDSGTDWTDDDGRPILEPLKRTG